jgi:predicted nucleic acid-binding protein
LKKAVSPALLDVNVLIALLDRRHVHHEAAHGWFAAAQANGWATSPLTQNAVLRILGQPRYPNSPGPPAVVAPLIAALIRHPQHQF